MTTPRGPPMPVDAQSNPFEDNREYGDHGAQCVDGGTP
jgi:hypothetical protein